MDTFSDALRSLNDSIKDVNAATDLEDLKIAVDNALRDIHVTFTRLQSAFGDLSR